MNENHKKVYEMRLSGMTYQSIGDALGVSRQRIHQMIEKIKYVHNKDISHVVIKKKKVIKRKRHKIQGMKEGEGCCECGLRFARTAGETPVYHNNNMYCSFCRDIIIRQEQK